MISFLGYDLAWEGSICCSFSFYFEIGIETRVSNATTQKIHVEDSNPLDGIPFSRYDIQQISMDFTYFCSYDQSDTIWSLNALNLRNKITIAILCMPFQRKRQKQNNKFCMQIVSDSMHNWRIDRKTWSNANAASWKPSTVLLSIYTISKGSRSMIGYRWP